MKSKPTRKNNRTTYTYNQRKAVEKKQKEEEEKRNYECKVVLSSLGIEVYE